jgi:hypothetical protein
LFAPSINPINPDEIYMECDLSAVFHSQNKGANWQDRTANNMKFYTKDVIIDTKNESVWYASVFQAWGSGVPIGSGGLYKTSDKGISWKQISTSYRVNSMTINPLKTNELYFITETEGLFFSDNIDSATPTFKNIDAYPFRHPMRVFFNPYKPTEFWVSSYGAGMMQSVAAVSCTNPTALISGTTSFCEGKNTNLSTPFNAAWSYQWFQNNVAIPNANQATFLASKAGIYSVKVSNGQCEAIAPNVTINALPLPSANIATANNQKFICGDTPLLLSSPNTVNVQYQWLFNNFSVGNTATFSATQSGQYTLQATQNGCSASSNINITQVTVLNTFQNDSTCINKKLAKNWTALNATSYVWSDSSVTNPIRQLGVGTYTLTTNFANACPNQKTITIASFPLTTLTVNANNSTLTAISTLPIVSYQWFWGGISVGTSNPYKATKSGVYTVLVTDKNGCTTLSSPTTITTIAINALQNPFSEKIVLKIFSIEKMSIELRLYAADGKLVKTLKEINLEQGEQNIEWQGNESLTTGAYYLKIINLRSQNAEFNSSQKLIKI